MSPNAVEALIPIAMMLCIFGIMYMFYTTRNRERLAMIEKGADPSLFQQGRPKGHSIRAGMFLVGIALGILMGNVLAVSTALQEEVSYFSMIFLFSGLSLVLHHLFFEKNRNSAD